MYCVLIVLLYILPNKFAKIYILQSGTERVRESESVKQRDGSCSTIIFLSYNIYCYFHIRLLGKFEWKSRHVLTRILACSRIRNKAFVNFVFISYKVELSTKKSGLTCHVCLWYNIIKELARSIRKPIQN